MRVHGPTTNHEEIRQWARAQKATPAQTYPAVHDGLPAVLRFLFGDISRQPEFESITWESFFAQFDAMGLAFVYESHDSNQPTGQYQLLQIEEKSPFRFEGKPV